MKQMNRTRMGVVFCAIKEISLVIRQKSYIHWFKTVLHYEHSQILKWSEYI